MFKNRLLPALALGLTLSLHPVHADSATLYLLDGTVVRGEIVDRSGKIIQIKTPSGVVGVRTSKLMPISRAQLKLPAEVEKDEEATPEMEALIAQIEKLVTENDALKKEIAALKNQHATSNEPATPAEGPAASHR